MVPDELAFPRALVFLLAQLARADGEVAEVEVDLIKAVGAERGLEASWVDALCDRLAAGAAIDAPDYAVLSSDIAETVTAARRLVAADGVLHDGEMRALEALRARLVAAG
jgi:uncharacterized tellurite resistance protein B-like protein